MVVFNCFALFEKAGIQRLSLRGAVVFLLWCDAGGSPAATHFLCFAKESKQRKATPGSSPLRGSLRCSRVKAAAELGLECATTQKVLFVLATQTVLADYPFTRSAARRLSWGPGSALSLSHRRRPVPNLTF